MSLNSQHNMIKQKDLVGALIVLSCYFYIIPIALWSFFAIIPFIIGVIVSASAMSSPSVQGWKRLYLVFAGTLLAFVLIFMWIIMPTIFLLIPAIPALVASSSLMIAHFSKDDKLNRVNENGSPF